MPHGRTFHYVNSPFSRKNLTWGRTRRRRLPAAWASSCGVARACDPRALCRPSAVRPRRRSERPGRAPAPLVATRTSRTCAPRRDGGGAPSPFSRRFIQPRRRVAVASPSPPPNFPILCFTFFFARPAGPALRGGGKGPISRAAPPGRAEPNLFRLGRTNPTRNPRTRNPACPADDPAGWVCVWGGGESRFPLRFRFIGGVSPRRIPEVFPGRAHRSRI